MASLDLHTRTPDIEAHARLAFRGDCPTCRRVRLQGTLPDPELVPPRAKAALVAGMMLASIAGPTATALAQDAPAIDPSAQVLPPGDSTPAASGGPDRRGGHGNGNTDGEQSGAGAAQPGPPADASPASQPAPPSALSHSESATRGATRDQRGTPARPHQDSTFPAPPSPAGAPAPAPAPQSSAAARSSPQPAAAPSPPAFARPAAPQGTSAPDPRPSTRAPTPKRSGSAGHEHGRRRAAGERRRSSGARVHVVKQGESLWLIARHALGPGASDAQIAELVSDLWNHNAGRIATGNPNLIQPGQTLEMPS